MIIFPKINLEITFFILIFAVTKKTMNMKAEWKDRLVALLDEMEDAQCGGMIPMAIFAAVTECKAYKKNENPNLGHWVVKAFMK